MKLTLAPWLIAIFLIYGCQNQQQNATLEQTSQGKTQEKLHSDTKRHWSYQGETSPEHWAEIEKQSECSGLHQSPINIIDVDAQNDSLLKPLDIHYSSQVRIHDVTNNGHTIQYNFNYGDFITINQEAYDLLQIHFHEASEHTINGVRYPLEMHMVHVNKLTNHTVVLAVMAIEGYSSEPFTFLENYLPVSKGETVPIDAYFDLNLNLPENKAYYTYQGSLTTPPCTENVRWYVFKNPISISLSQVKQLQLLMPLNNYRNEQALNDRKIFKFEG